MPSFADKRVLEAWGVARAISMALCPFVYPILVPGALPHLAELGHAFLTKHEMLRAQSAVLAVKGSLEASTILFTILDALLERWTIRHDDAVRSVVPIVERCVWDASVDKIFEQFFVRDRILEEVLALAFYQNSHVRHTLGVFRCASNLATINISSTVR